MYLGPVRVGETIGWIIQSRTQALAPVAADSAPTFRVYDGTTLLTTGTSAAFDSGNITGAYRCAVTASTGNGFARGRTYTIVGLWEVSTDARQEIATFQVV
jgi:hypothetical protein